MRNFTSLLVIACYLLMPAASFAQTPGIVGTNAFFAGQWLEVGEQSNGDFGTSSSPAGYYAHPDTVIGAGQSLDCVYDYGHDGWAVGTPPFMGDYTYPGSPFEGWELQVGSGRSQQFCSGEDTGSFVTSSAAVVTVSGSITGFSDISGKQISTWSGTSTGTAGNIAIIQQTEVDTFASWVTINVKMYNTGSTATDTIYYLRTNDPDNNESWGGSFTTENYIDYQNDSLHRVQVRASTAIPAPGNRYPFSLCAKDARAVAFIYDSWPIATATDLASVWYGSYGGAFYNVSPSSHTGDIAIGLIFKLGALAPGDSTSFSYAYTFNGISGIDSAFSSNDSAGIITGTASTCIGSTTTLSDDSTGGTWTSSSVTVATIDTTSGTVTGISAGATTITYTIGTSYTTFVVTVYGTPSISTTLPLLCSGGTDTLTASPASGTWSTSSSIVTIGASTGSVTGISSGTALVTYTAATGCTATTIITIHPALSAITGPTSLCEASAITLSDASVGGTWSSSSIGIAPVGSATGIVAGISSGTAIITYNVSAACTGITEVTVYPLPAISIGVSGACGGTDTLAATVSGGGTPTWSPPVGLSCITCDTAIATFSTTTTYSATATSSFACSATDTITLDGNRIAGFITATVTPTDTLKVWLIQFNPIDSTLTGEDSLFTCMDSGTPYYEFDNEPAGSYLVKAKLLSAVPGATAYVPTYGLSTIHWDTATTITHASTTDTQHINMIYGIVPPGPGFIGGLISAGAGRGTSTAIPIAGMIVYLENASGNILTYTYTDTSGIYSFNGLADGSYTVYPADYHYNTIPWTNIRISAATDSFTIANFYQYHIAQVISPDTISNLSVQQINAANLSIFPNPTTSQLTITMSPAAYNSFSITNSIGQELIQQPLTQILTNVNVNALAPGLYYITLRGDNGTEVRKFVKM